MITEPFESFFMGGFECASHRRRDGTRVDVIAETRHDDRCEADYALLKEAGIRTVRDGLRWHRIETVAGVYDWSSFLPMLDAAISTETQVIWDLCHWGVPDGLDIFSLDFVERFAAFASAASSLILHRNLAAGIRRPQMYCPINEMSFWSWVGGDERHFWPFAAFRGQELKQQLTRASLAAMRAVRAVDPQARFVQAEPIIHIAAYPERPQDSEAAEQHTAAQYEVWDMLTGQRTPQLGGSPDMLDIIGVNFYWNNQWVHGGERTPPGHKLHRPLHRMLQDVWARFHRPIVIAETGTEADSENGWLGYVCAEVRRAQRSGVDIAGICLYPVMDYVGWDDSRHCKCGLIESRANWSDRRLREDLREELRVQQAASLRRLG